LPDWESTNLRLTHATEEIIKYMGCVKYGIGLDTRQVISNLETKDFCYTRS